MTIGVGFVFEQQGGSFGGTPQSGPMQGCESPPVGQIYIRAGSDQNRQRISLVVKRRQVQRISSTKRIPFINRTGSVNRRAVFKKKFQNVRIASGGGDFNCRSVHFVLRLGERLVLRQQRRNSFQIIHIDRVERSEERRVGKECRSR